MKPKTPTSNAFGATYKLAAQASAPMEVTAMHSLAHFEVAQVLIAIPIGRVDLKHRGTEVTEERCEG